MISSYLILYNIISQSISHRIISHIISYYHIISYHFISYHIISYHIISYHMYVTTLHHTTPHHITIYHIISYRDIVTKEKEEGKYTVKIFDNKLEANFSLVTVDSLIPCKETNGNVYNCNNYKYVYTI